MACAVELDPRRQRVVGYLNDDVSQRRLSLFTLQLLFPEQPDVGLAISPGGGLRRAALLAPAEPGVLGSVALAPSPTVFWWLAGDRARDPDLPAGTEHIAPGAGRSRSGPPKPGSAIPGPAKPRPEKPGPAKPRSAKAGPARDETPTAPPGNDCLDFDRLVLVPGGDKLRRRQAAIASLGPLLASPLPASPPAWDALVRQATLEQGGVLIELDGPLPAEARQRIEQADHLSWALASVDELPLDCLPAVPWRELAVAPAPANDIEWAEAVASLAALGTLGEDVAPEITDGAPSADGPSSGHPVLGNYGLSAEQLELVRLAAPGVGGISAAVRRLAAGHISTLAPRTRPSRNWDDLVLDRDRTERLREIVARCRHKKKYTGHGDFQRCRRAASSACSPVRRAQARRWRRR